MSKAPLPTYLRTYRKRAGLSQREVAALIGAAAGATVSRHEASLRSLSLADAFAYEALFGVPASALFPGAYETARARIEQETIALLGSLSRMDDTAVVEQKRRFLEAVLGRVRS